MKRVITLASVAVLGWTMTVRAADGPTDIGNLTLGQLDQALAQANFHGSDLDKVAGGCGYPPSRYAGYGPGYYGHPRGYAVGYRGYGYGPPVRYQDYRPNYGYYGGYYGGITAGAMGTAADPTTAERAWAFVWAAEAVPSLWAGKSCA